MTPLFKSDIIIKAGYYNYLAFVFKDQRKGECTVPSFTRKAIKETFIKLIDERPLNEVTVKDIVEECGINRNSFYYHFKDLPSLIEEIVKEETDNVIREYSSLGSIAECFDAIVEDSSTRKRAIMHIYKSVNRDIFERYLMEASEYFVKTYISVALAEEKLSPEDTAVVVDYYKCLCFGLIINWLNSGMNEESAHSFRRIFRLKTDTAVDIAKKLKEQI